MRHKYVRCSGLGVAMFLADTPLSHADIGYAMRRNGGKVVSAGFFWFDRNGTVSIENRRSESLNIGPAADDKAAIEKQLGLLSDSEGVCQ